MFSSYRLNQQGFPTLETLFKVWFIEAHVTHPGNRQVFSSYRLNQQGFPTLETLFKAWFIEAHVTHPVQIYSRILSL